MTAAELTAHAEQLAREHNVRIRWDAKPYRARFLPDERVIHATPITNHGYVVSPDGGYNLLYDEHGTYFIAMHELGHVAHRHEGWRTGSIEVLREEAQAWQWAAENSAIPLDPRMIQHALSALTHYRETRGVPLEYVPAEWVQTTAALRNWIDGPSTGAQS